MAILRYRPRAEDASPDFVLVAGEGTADERRFPFRDRIEIGRLESGAQDPEGRILVDDPTISAMHCVLVRNPDGRLYVRDTSRNGTRLGGRRVLPNREEEIRAGESLVVGAGVTFRLVEAEATMLGPGAARRPSRPTLVEPCSEQVTVLVGDIRGYTTLLTAVRQDQVQRAVAQLFARLEREVRARGGQVKEYQGDSMLAFWEPAEGTNPAIAACRAALALHRLVEGVAQEEGAWPFPSYTLGMDWAVTTGRVSVQVLGEDRPEELSLVGEVVVLAYRLEKVADRDSGPIIVCEATRSEGEGAFLFRDLGPRTLAGFPRPVRAYALVEALEAPGTGIASLERSPA